MTAPPPVASTTRVRRRPWLPRPIYVLVPYLYAATGAAALLSALYVPHWYWGAPLLALIGLLALHAAAWIFARRRGNRRVDSGGGDR